MFRSIVLSDEMVLEYDVLIIASASEDNSYLKWNSTSLLHPNQCEEKGIFSLGSSSSDEQAMMWFRQNYDSRSTVVVFGNSIEAINAVGRMMKFGIDPQRICLVLTEFFIESFGQSIVRIVAN